LEPEVLEDSALLGGGSEPVSFYFESYGDNGMERELQTGMEVLTETGEGGTVTGKVEKFVPERGDRDEARYGRMRYFCDEWKILRCRQKIRLKRRGLI
jgi:hypothetical protein